MKVINVSSLIVVNIEWPKELIVKRDLVRNICTSFDNSAA